MQEFALKYKKDTPVVMVEPGFKKKSAHLIVTMDAHPFLYALTIGNHGFKLMEKAFLGVCGIRPVHITKVGHMPLSTKQKRQKSIDRIRKKGEKLL